jgi:two-component system OmpR family response regulator
MHPKLKLARELNMLCQTATRSPARILVVDDDASTRGAMADYLADHCFITQTASGQHGTVSHFHGTEPDLVVLGIPQQNHEELDPLIKVRSCSNVPIIVTDRHDRGELGAVAALELGADDYLTHPLSLRELLARVGAVLRRERTSQRIWHHRMQEGYRFAGWLLDQRQRCLKDPSGIPVRLTKCEFAVLVALLNAPLQPLTREQILNATRIQNDVFDRCIDVYIARLRRKLEANPSEPRIILTERGIGYVFGLPVDPL